MRRHFTVDAHLPTMLPVEHADLSALVGRSPAASGEGTLMNDESQTLIFVYGTLKRGFCRAPFLSDQQFLEEACTAPRYALYDCGEYPALVKDNTTGIRIQGELWRVDARGLEVLDEVEGVAEQLYARESIELETPLISTGVQAYFYLPDVSQLPRLGDCWTRQT